VEKRKHFIGLELTDIDPHTGLPVGSSATERHEIEIPPVVGRVLEVFGIQVVHIDEVDSIDDPNSDLNTRR